MQHSNYGIISNYKQIPALDCGVTSFCLTEELIVEGCEPDMELRHWDGSFEWDHADTLSALNYIQTT